MIPVMNQQIFRTNRMKDNNLNLRCFLGQHNNMILVMNDNEGLTVKGTRKVAELPSCIGQTGMRKLRVYSVPC